MRRETRLSRIYFSDKKITYDGSACHTHIGAWEACTLTVFKIKRERNYMNTTSARVNIPLNV